MSLCVIKPCLILAAWPVIHVSLVCPKSCNISHGRLNLTAQCEKCLCLFSVISVPQDVMSRSQHMDKPPLTTIAHRPIQMKSKDRDHNQGE